MAFGGFEDAFLQQLGVGRLPRELGESGGHLDISGAPESEKLVDRILPRISSILNYGCPVGLTEFVQQGI